MSPVRFKAEDFDTLGEWNVNLVRAQMIRNWGKAGTDRDLGEYDARLNGMLDHFEKMFPLGYRKGIRFVIDLHTLPGGRYESGEMAMFHEKEYADHFIADWKKIAERFKNNPAVWGYDLVNEPSQIRRAPDSRRRVKFRKRNVLSRSGQPLPAVFCRLDIPLLLFLAGGGFLRGAARPGSSPGRHGRVPPRKQPVAENINLSTGCNPDFSVI